MAKTYTPIKPKRTIRLATNAHPETFDPKLDPQHLDLFDLSQTGLGRWTGLGQPGLTHDPEAGS